MDSDMVRPVGVSSYHVIEFSYLFDLWVIKILKKPMILCARSTSSSSEQSTKRRSRSESMRNFCFFHSQNNNIYDYQTWQTRFWRNSRGAQRFVGFFLDCAFQVLIG